MTSWRVRLGSVASVIALALGVASVAPAARSSHKERCPKHTLALPADAVAGATVAALRSAPTVYSDKDRRGMRVTVASRGTNPNALAVCGRRVQDHTVAVTLAFPAERPSAALSRGVALVARFKAGYRVWYRFQ